MKSLFLLTSCASLAIANAVDCDLANVLPLLKDPNVIRCSADTSFAPPTPPSADMLPLICVSTSCQSALATIKALGLGDCTIGTMKLETDLVHPIEAFCAADSASTPITTSKTTTSPGAAGSSSTTKNTSASDVVAPAKTTPTPSPAITSSVSSLQTAASAAAGFFVVAVAAFVQ